HPDHHDHRDALPGRRDVPRLAGGSSPSGRSRPARCYRPLKEARLDTSFDASTSAEVIETRGASVRFGERRLWSGVDLAIGPGTFSAIRGPNGGGNSTLVEVLQAL